MSMKAFEDASSLQSFTLMALPETLDLRAAAPLTSAFLSVRGTGLRVDASQVRYVGAQCLQVILSAKMTWRRDGQSLVITEPSQQFLESLMDCGLPIHDLMESDIET